MNKTEIEVDLLSEVEFDERVHAGAVVYLHVAREAVTVSELSRVLATYLETDRQAVRWSLVRLEGEERLVRCGEMVSLPAGGDTREIKEQL